MCVVQREGSRHITKDAEERIPYNPVIVGQGQAVYVVVTIFCLKLGDQEMRSGIKNAPQFHRFMHCQTFTSV
jgi:hypothetical protein